MEILSNSASASSFLPSERLVIPVQLKASCVSSSRRPCRWSIAACSLVPSSQASSTGLIFEPFTEAQSQVAKIPPHSSESFARQRFSSACEAAINDHINVEYNASYVYHTLFAYFDRDNVGLPGFAKFFQESSDHERSHADKLMKYQNIRGGKVQLRTIAAPTLTEFDHEEKGDALHAMEITLALEKLVNEKLLELHKIAEEEGDPQMQDFIEGEFLEDQVEDIKKISEYVSQLRRVGKGHGVYHFDLKLQEEA